MKDLILSTLLGLLLTFLAVDYFMKRAEMRGCETGLGNYFTITVYQSTGQLVKPPAKEIHLLCVDLLRRTND